MKKATVFRTAAVMGFLAVALGAFGAHGLKPVLLERNTLSFWETAVLYQFAHLAAFVLLALTDKVSRAAYLCFVTGIVMFSGSLYILALVKVKPLVFITPLGGLLLLAGWVLLFLTSGKAKTIA